MRDTRMMRKVNKYIGWFISIWMILGLVFPVESIAQVTKAKDNLIQGSLSNGLRYYIKSIPSETKLHMNLIVKAGSIVQDKNQYEVAHLLEHLSLRESEHFPNGIANSDSLLTAIGNRGIGRDFYAFTGYEEVSYTYNANVGNYQSMETGLIWFRDIAEGLKLSSKDIRIEKELVKQENALKSSAKSVNKSLLFQNVFPCMANKYEYDKKVDAVQLSDIKRFYKDYYQPQNLAIRIVGNVVEPEILINKIKLMFGELKNSNSKVKLEACSVIDPSGVSQFEVLERLVPLEVDDHRVSINLFYRDEPYKDKPISTQERIDRLKQKIIQELMAEAFQKEMASLREVYNPKFDFLIKGYSNFMNSPSLIWMEIMTDPEDVEYTLETVFDNINMFRSFGVSKEEWDVLKNRKLSMLKKKENAPLYYWEKEILNNFLHEELLVDGKETMIKYWLQKLSYRDFNSQIETFFGKKPKNMMIMVAKGHKKSIAKNYISNLIDNTLKEHKTSIRKNNEISEVLMSDSLKQSLEPKAYTQIQDSTKYNRYRLNNGLEVILVNDTTLKNKVEIHGFSPIGALSLPERDFYAASYAPRLVKHSGIGNFDKFQLEHLTNKYKGLNYYQYINPNETGIKVTANSRDIENLMQLIFLSVSKPRKDKAAFDDWKNSIAKSLLDPTYNLRGINFSNHIKEYMKTHDIAFHMGSTFVEQVQKLNLGRMLEAYSKLFLQSERFTYIIYGDYDEEIMLKLSQKYLGNLPVIPVKLKEINIYNRKDVMTLKSHEVEFQSFKPSDNIIFSTISFTEPKPFSWKENLKVQFLGNILLEKTFALRFDKDFALYDLIGGGFYDDVLHRYKLMTKMDCTQEEFEQVKEATGIIFKDLRAGKIENHLYTKVYQEIEKRISLASESPRSLNDFYQYYNKNYYQEDFLKKAEKLEFLQSLTIDEIKSFAEDFLKEEHLFKFTMY
ncbi:M16 family metallopeptidase [Zunongwangia sp. HGR-M22]|uniref:M16 family metallopeptidase n=1 Tax=Zunongwangia sp. HGR-M22 TaxID=3015168 RepID=UPI0022DE24F2|nr:insulinase family protein [Zunongwangia sp. HGR-M22]WBL26700.1 insulinase family protein [Zunongwangia sp. HGR-M22]